MDASAQEASALDASDAGLQSDTSDCGVPTLTDPVSLATSANWLTMGASTLRDTYGEILPLAGGLGGALLWKPGAPASLDTLHLTFDFSITYEPGPSAEGQGDGIMFVGLQSPPNVCATGGAMCALGMNAPGFAIIVRTYAHGSGEPPAPYVAIADTATFIFPGDDGGSTFPAIPYVTINPLTNVETPLDGSVDDTTPPPAASWHSMGVSIAKDIATITIDGATVLLNAPVPSSVGLSGYWGFTSGSGGAMERAAVRNVVIAKGPSTCGD